MSSLNDMEKEIVEAEAFLKGLNPRGGFSVPENYFEQLQERLELMGDEPLMEDELASLNRMGAEGGFNIPTDYFKALEGKVIDSVLEENNEAKVISLLSYKRYWLASMAAAFLITAFVFLWKDQKSAQVAESSRLEIEQVADHLEVGDLNEELLCDAGWCDEITTLPGIGGDLSADYLNEIETDLLIEEL